MQEFDWVNLAQKEVLNIPAFHFLQTNIMQDETFGLLYKHYCVLNNKSIDKNKLTSIQKRFENLGIIGKITNNKQQLDLIHGFYTAIDDLKDLKKYESSLSIYSYKKIMYEKICEIKEKFQACRNDNQLKNLSVFKDDIFNTNALNSVLNVMRDEIFQTNVLDSVSGNKHIEEALKDGNTKKSLVFAEMFESNGQAFYLSDTKKNLKSCYVFQNYKTWKDATESTLIDLKYYDEKGQCTKIVISNLELFKSGMKRFGAIDEDKIYLSPHQLESIITSNTQPHEISPCYQNQISATKVGEKFKIIMLEKMRGKHKSLEEQANFLFFMNAVLRYFDGEPLSGTGTIHRWRSNSSNRTADNLIALWSIIEKIPVDLKDEETKEFLEILEYIMGFRDHNTMQSTLLLEAFKDNMGDDFSTTDIGLGAMIQNRCIGGSFWSFLKENHHSLGQIIIDNTLNDKNAFDSYYEKPETLFSDNLMTSDIDIQVLQNIKDQQKNSVRFLNYIYRTSGATALQEDIYKNISSLNNTDEQKKECVKMEGYMFNKNSPNYSLAIYNSIKDNACFFQQNYPTHSAQLIKTVQALMNVLGDENWSFSKRIKRSKPTTVLEIENIIKSDIQNKVASRETLAKIYKLLDKKLNSSFGLVGTNVTAKGFYNMLREQIKPIIECDDNPHKLVLTSKGITSGILSYQSYLKKKCAGDPVKDHWSVSKNSQTIDLINEEIKRLDGDHNKIHRNALEFKKLQLTVADSTTDIHLLEKYSLFCQKKKDDMVKVLENKATEEDEARLYMDFKNFKI